MNIWQKLPDPFFVLAPMDDVTDTVFRRVVNSCAKPDISFTEFVSVDGLQSAGRSRLLKKLQFTLKEKPLIAQIWGKRPENYFITAHELVSMGFDGVDINMGCPDKTIMKNGCCSALIDNRTLAQEIIAAVKEGVAGRVPVSVKTRLGINEVDMSWPEFLLKQNISALTIHGRTSKQMSLVPANWDLIKEVCNKRNEIAPETAIIGNGDIKSKLQGQDYARRYGVDGLMIGRGILADPFAFADQSPWPSKSKAQRLELYKKHVELYAATWTVDEQKIHTLNKFCKIYVNGFDGAKELREKLMHMESCESLLAALSN